MAVQLHSTTFDQPHITPTPDIQYLRKAKSIDIGQLKNIEAQLCSKEQTSTTYRHGFYHLCRLGHFPEKLLQEIKSKTLDVWDKAAILAVVAAQNYEDPTIQNWVEELARNPEPLRQISHSTELIFFGKASLFYLKDKPILLQLTLSTIIRMIESKGPSLSPNSTRDYQMLKAKALESPREPELPIVSSL